MEEKEEREGEGRRREGEKRTAASKSESTGEVEGLESITSG